MRSGLHTRGGSHEARSSTLSVDPGVRATDGQDPAHDHRARCPLQLAGNRLLQRRRRPFELASRGGRVRRAHKSAQVAPLVRATLAPGRRDHRHCLYRRLRVARPSAPASGASAGEGHHRDRRCGHTASSDPDRRQGRSHRRNFRRTSRTAPGRRIPGTFSFTSGGWGGGSGQAAGGCIRRLPKGLRQASRQGRARHLSASRRRNTAVGGAGGDAGQDRVRARPGTPGPRLGQEGRSSRRRARRCLCLPGRRRTSRWPIRRGQGRLQTATCNSRPRAAMPPICEPCSPISSKASRR